MGAWGGGVKSCKTGKRTNFSKKSVAQSVTRLLEEKAAAVNRTTPPWGANP